MKATALLEDQHRKVELLFTRLESGEAEVLPELADELMAHMMIEHELFYPAVRSIDTERVTDSFEEHAIAELALRRVLATEEDEEPFAARVSVLRQLIRHHVDEEEGDLFPTVEAELSADQLEQLGKRMKSRFDEIVDGAGSSVSKVFDETSSDRARGPTVGHGANDDDEQITQRAPQRIHAVKSKAGRKKSSRPAARPAR